MIGEEEEEDSGGMTTSEMEDCPVVKTLNPGVRTLVKVVSCKLLWFWIKYLFIFIPCKAEPRQRPKLNLAPRTKPIEASKPEPAVPSASIFGNAKPVDTAERERQIEEKLRKEQEERLKESSGRDGGRESRDQSADRESVSKSLFF